MKDLPPLPPKENVDQTRQLRTYNESYDQYTGQSGRETKLKSIKMMRGKEKEEQSGANNIETKNTQEIKTNLYTKGDTGQNTLIKLTTINMRDLNNDSKHNRLMDFIIRNKFDITVVTETNLSEASSKYFTNKFPNYKVFWAPAPSKGSGIIVIIERSLAKYIHQMNHLEGRLLRIRLLLGARKLNILAVYLLANPKDKKQFHRKAQA